MYETTKSVIQILLLGIVFVGLITYTIVNIEMRDSSPKIVIHKLTTYSVEYKYRGLGIDYTKTVEVPKSVFDKINDGDTMLVFTTKELDK